MGLKGTVRCLGEETEKRRKRGNFYWDVKITKQEECVRGCIRPTLTVRNDFLNLGDQKK